MTRKVYIGVDVGTKSVRSLAIDSCGNILGYRSLPIDVLNPKKDFYEQNSAQIWGRTCETIRSLMSDCDLSKDDVRGLGFDATCSLVVLDKNGGFVNLHEYDGMTGCDPANIIMWMDHRAAEEAARIDATEHPMLKFVGNSISLEMESPKLLWLKNHIPSEAWSKSFGYFMDLADFLTYQATGKFTRSLCCLVCKWMYCASPDTQHWDDSFFEQIGLVDLCEDGYSRIGATVLPPGHPIKNGLNSQAALDTGLNEGIPVATGIIDAHAGVIGSLATDLKDISDMSITNCLSLICGTSTCHMSLSPSPKFVPGVWGPFFGSIFPNLWTNEAGQTAVGSILDQLIADYIPADSGAHDRVVNYLLDFERIHGSVELALLTKDIHVWPDYHGNRAPLADPRMPGAVIGLSLHNRSPGTDIHYACSLYLAHIYSFGYMTKWIVETLNQHGYKDEIQRVFASGGLAKNPLYIQAHSDILGMPLIVSHCDETVALGSSILAAQASGDFGSITEAMKHLGQSGTTYKPNQGTREFHVKKYAVFMKMRDTILESRKIMA